MKIARQFEKGNTGKPSRKDVKKVSKLGQLSLSNGAEVEVNPLFAFCLKFQGVPNWDTICWKLGDNVRQIELKIRYFDIWDKKAGTVPSAPYVNTCRKMQYRATAPPGILEHRKCNFLSEDLNPNKIRIMHMLCMPCYGKLHVRLKALNITQNKQGSTCNFFRIISMFSLLGMKPQPKHAIASNW